MNTEPALRAAKRLADRFMLAGAVALSSGSALLLYGIFMSTSAAEYPLNVGNRGHPTPASADSEPLGPLLARMAGRRLISPPQVQPAVRDTGAAKRLLKKLALQGVVQIGDKLVAYVKLEQVGVRAVRNGETILDFLVERIELGKVTLSLEGVIVTLTH
jgi:hypothetical protein